MIEKAAQHRWKFRLIALILNCCVASVFSQVEIQVSHLVGKERLQLDTATYHNELQQDFKVSNLKYYIGQLIFTKSDGTTEEYKDYFLIDEYEAESKKITLKSLPEGTYTSMSFLLGVDSASNCSGAQSGALDPMYAMFWAWNSGYIFFKLEGSSSYSTAPGKQYEFHIGGFKQPVNNIKRIEISFSEKLIVKSKEHLQINLSMDVLEVLKNPNLIDFSEHHSITGTEHSTLISSNYTDVFRLISILHVP